MLVAGAGNVLLQLLTSSFLSDSSSLTSIYEFVINGVLFQDQLMTFKP